MGKIAYCARKLSLRPRRQNVFACALIPRTADTKPTWEFPRLCRGGSKSLTYPAVNAAAASRRAAKHTKGIVSMDGLKADASDHGAVMQALPPEQGSQARDIMLRHSSVEEVQPR